MTKRTIPQMPKERQWLFDYFRTGRAEAIERYRAAYTKCRRNEQRGWALHYGRLMRKMEGRA